MYDFFTSTQVSTMFGLSICSLIRYATQHQANDLLRFLCIIYFRVRSPKMLRTPIYLCKSVQSPIVVK